MEFQEVFHAFVEVIYQEHALAREVDSVGLHDVLEELVAHADEVAHERRLEVLELLASVALGLVVAVSVVVGAVLGDEVVFLEPELLGVRVLHRGQRLEGELVLASPLDRLVDSGTFGGGHDVLRQPLVDGAAGLPDVYLTGILLGYLVDARELAVFHLNLTHVFVICCGEDIRITRTADGRPENLQVPTGLSGRHPDFLFMGYEGVKRKRADRSRPFVQPPYYRCSLTVETEADGQQDVVPSVFRFVSQCHNRFFVCRFEIDD